MAKRDFDELEAANENEGHPSAPKRMRTQSPPPGRLQPPTPWHNNNYILRKFTLEELGAEDILGSPDAHFGDLSNPIHPLFHKLISEEHLHPALRLASLFLTQLECLPFYLALIARPYDHLPELEKKLQGPCYRFTLGPQPPRLRHLENLRMFLQVAVPMIDIKFSRDCPATAWAVCYRRFEPHGLAQFQGTSSSIAVNPSFVQFLDPRLNADATTSQRLRLSLMFANTLAHEIAHALRNARMAPPPLNTTVQPPRPMQDYEPFFEDQRRAEVGHAWETVVVGGKLTDVTYGENSVEYGLFLEKWPDVDDYFIRLPINEPPLISFQGRGLVVPPRTHIVPVRRRKAKKWTSLYGVPMAFIQQLFTKRFWEERIPKEGLQALRFKKTLGVRTRNFEWEEGEEPGIASDDSSWGRWPDVDGVIRTGQPKMASPVLEEFDDWASSSDEDDPGYGDVEEVKQAELWYNIRMETDNAPANINTSVERGDRMSF